MSEYGLLYKEFAFKATLYIKHKTTKRNKCNVYFHSEHLTPKSKISTSFTHQYIKIFDVLCINKITCQACAEWKFIWNIRITLYATFFRSCDYIQCLFLSAHSNTDKVKMKCGVTYYNTNYTTTEHEERKKKHEVLLNVKQSQENVFIYAMW